jgi:hypothetical protein
MSAAARAGDQRDRPVRHRRRALAGRDREAHPPPRLRTSLERLGRGAGRLKRDGDDCAMVMERCCRTCTGCIRCRQRESGSRFLARVWSCATLLAAMACKGIPDSAQSRATYQRMSESRSRSSLLCCGARLNRPDSDAAASREPVLADSSCNPTAGSRMRSRLFRKERGTWFTTA